MHFSGVVTEGMRGFSPLHPAPEFVGSETRTEGEIDNLLLSAPPDLKTLRRLCNSRAACLGKADFDLVSSAPYVVALWRNSAAFTCSSCA